MMTMIAKRSVLVTGASGFVGSYVLQKLVEDGKSAVGYDAAPPPPYLKDEIRKRVIKGDILDFTRLFSLIRDQGVEGIIHTIAMQPSTGSEEMPVQAMKINVDGTLNVLEAARLADLRRVVFCSTVSVYGNRGLTKVKEDEPPLLPFEEVYGLSKFAAEQLCLWYHKRFGVDAVTLRLVGVYGPGQRPFKKPFIAGAQPIDWFVHSALKDGRVEAEEIGDMKKDYTYVKDVAQGIFLAYEKEKPKYRLYNISGGKLIAIDEIVRAIRKVLPNVSVKVGPGAGEILPYPDISRARVDLNYEPQYDIERAIADYVEWLRKEISLV
jgi:nucleoside-diphosphate-sugar epimerase